MKKKYSNTKYKKKINKLYRSKILHNKNKFKTKSKFKIIKINFIIIDNLSMELIFLDQL